MKYLKRVDTDTTSKSFVKCCITKLHFYHNRDSSPDLPSDASPEEREALKGYSIQIHAHKTGKDGIILKHYSQILQNSYFY